MGNRYLRQQKIKYRVRWIANIKWIILAGLKIEESDAMKKYDEEAKNLSNEFLRLTRLFLLD